MDPVLILQFFSLLGGSISFREGIVTFLGKHANLRVDRLKLLQAARVDALLNIRLNRVQFGQKVILRLNNIVSDIHHLVL